MIFHGNVNKRRLAFDALLALVLLGMALLCFLLLRPKAGDGAVVRVYIDGELASEHSLSDDGEYVLNGGTNVLTISGGTAAVTRAECPDHVCVRTGAISRVGERIVCLPNRVMVEIVGDSELDFVQ